MNIIKLRLCFFSVIVASILVTGCTHYAWYESHGIDRGDFYSEESVKSYLLILAGENLPDMQKVSRITRNMRIKNDKLAELLFEKSMTLNNDSFLLNATTHFINNHYYKYGIQAINKGLCAYNNKTRLWFARQAGNIAQRTDTSALLPVLKKMATPGYDKREIQTYARRAIKIIEYSQYQTEKAI